MIKKNPSSKSQHIGSCRTSKLVQFKAHYFALYIPCSHRYNSSLYKRVLSSCMICSIYWQLKDIFLQKLGNQWILTWSFSESIRLNICTVLILTHSAGYSDYCMTSDLACLTLITKQEKNNWLCTYLFCVSWSSHSLLSHVVASFSESLSRVLDASSSTAPAAENDEWQINVSTVLQDQSWPFPPGQVFKQVSCVKQQISHMQAACLYI